MPSPLLDCARRFIGIREVAGAKANPIILAMLQLETGNAWASDDSVPWCSAFVDWIAFVLGYERSKSLAAASWLTVGQHVEPLDAQLGDVVIFKNHLSVLQPGQNPAALVVHVGFLASTIMAADTIVYCCGGNQADAVSIAGFYRSAVLEIRRLSPTPPRV